MKKENNVKPNPFHLLINIFHYIFLPVFILLILNVNAHAGKREVRVGVYANKPLVYQDENGEHKGLSIDVLRFAASKENWKLEFVPCSWSECLEMLERGENDIQVIIAKTPERVKIYDFTSQSLYSLWAQIFIHPDSDIQSWTDLKGKNVAVYKDDLFSETFKKLIREFGIDCNLIEVENYQAMLKLIKEKKADAGVFIQTFAEQYATRGIVRRTPIMFNPVPIYFAFPKGKVPELVTAIDRHLKMLKEDKDSIYYHSLDKIFVKERGLTIPHWIKWIMIVAPSLMLLSIIGSMILRRQVKARTAELFLKNTKLEEEISERKQAEEALRKSRGHLRLALGAARIAVWDWNIRENYTTWSDTAEEVLGFKPGSFGNNYEAYMKWVHPDDIEAVNDRVSRVLEEKQSDYKSEYRVIRPDGEIRWESAPGQISYGSDGEPLRIAGIMMDITERKQAKEKLQEAHKKLKISIDNMPNAYILCDIETLVLEWNKAAEKIFGYSKEEMLGKNLIDFIVPEKTRHLVGEAVKKLKVGEVADYSEKDNNIRKDGKLISCQWFNTPLADDNGKVFGILFMGQDVSERMQAEEALREAHDELERRVEERTAELVKTNEQLQCEIEERKTAEEELRKAKEAADAASRAKSDFLASMSHELRTPLNSIIGFSQVLCDGYFGSLTKKQEEYVNDILDSGKHLLALINDILDLSKIDAGKFELELGDVHIAQLLEYSLIMIKEKAHRHEISLDLNISKGVSDLVFSGDERKLKQVIFNLLSNAAKFTPDGGSIAVEARMEGKELVVSVSDTGIGIAPGEQKKIFDEFYQARGGIVDKTPGTGLGLSISKKLVEMHSGRMWVESDGEGKGSRFSFILPLKTDFIETGEPKAQIDE